MVPEMDLVKVLLGDDGDAVALHGSCGDDKQQVKCQEPLVAKVCSI